IHVMPDGDEGSALCAFLRDLGTGAHQVRSVLIEGGPTLAWSAVHAGVVDRFVAYLAPKLIGGSGSPGALGGDGVGTIAEALPVEFESIERVGEDLKVSARVRPAS